MPGRRISIRRNLEVVTVDTGNPSANVIPAECRARFNVRFNDTWQPDTLAAEIRLRLEAAGIGAHRLSFAPCNALAFVTEPGPFSRIVAEAVEAETGIVPVLSTTGGTSDARVHHPGLPRGGVSGSSATRCMPSTSGSASPTSRGCRGSMPACWTAISRPSPERVPGGRLRSSGQNLRRLL